MAESYGHALTTLRLLLEHEDRWAMSVPPAKISRARERLNEAAQRDGLSVPKGYESYKARD